MSMLSAKTRMSFHPSDEAVVTPFHTYIIVSCSLSVCRCRTNRKLLAHYADYEERHAVT